MNNNKKWFAFLTVGIAAFVLILILSNLAILHYIFVGAVAILGYIATIKYLNQREKEKAIKEAEEQEALQQRAKKDSAQQFDSKKEGCFIEIEEIVLKNPELDPYVQPLKEQWTHFDDQNAALNKLIEYKVSAKKFCLTQTEATQQILLRNLEKFTSLAVAYAATKTEALKGLLNGIVEKNEGIITCYSELIVEVARMNDNFDENDERLRAAVQSLRNLRETDEAEAAGDETPDNPFD